MPRIYTEIRIHHKTQEEREKYEKAITKALEILGYKSRAEWMDEALGKLVKEAVKKDPKGLTGLIKKMEEPK